MSKIGKIPIQIPEKTEVKIQDKVVMVKGPKGDLTWEIPNLIKIKVEDNILKVERDNDTKEAKSLHGLCRSKIANMVHGVNEGWSKALQISGVGFKAEVKDQTIVLNVGFSHPVILPIISGVEVQVAKNDITVSGLDKELVGEMAARIRATKKPEPYKGKGIKYKDEIIRRKAGKAAKSGDM